eukprot:c17003_g1_i1 orf=111-1055(+)
MTRIELAWMGIRRQPRRVWVWSAAIFCFLVLMLVTPRIPQDQSYHDFADQRNLIGIPNSLNVISNFPYLIIGLVGFVLCFHSNYLGLSSRGELWGWAFFYVGVTATAFGSAYYHLKPNDSTLVWDRLPMTIAFSSIMALFIIERIDERQGTIWLAPLLLVGAVSVAYWRFANDLRPYALVQFVPCFAIPIMTIALPPKYTHSSYWLWGAGFYLIAKVEEATDKGIYNLTHHIVSGHTLKHLCSAMVPVFVTMMLIRRRIDLERKSLWEIWSVQVKTSYFFQADKLSLYQIRKQGEKDSNLQDETETLVQKLDAV